MNGVQGLHAGILTEGFDEDYARRALADRYVKGGLSEEAHEVLNGREVKSCGSTWTEVGMNRKHSSERQCKIRKRTGAKQVSLHGSEEGVRAKLQARFSMDYLIQESPEGGNKQGRERIQWSILNVIAWVHAELEDTNKKRRQHQSLLEVNAMSRRTRKSEVWLISGFIVDMVRVTVQMTKQGCWVTSLAEDMNKDDHGRSEETSGYGNQGGQVQEKVQENQEDQVTQEDQKVQKSQPPQKSQEFQNLVVHSRINVAMKSMKALPEKLGSDAGLKDTTTTPTIQQEQTWQEKVAEGEVLKKKLRQKCFLHREFLEKEESTLGLLGKAKKEDRSPSKAFHVNLMDLEKGEIKLGSWCAALLEARWSEPDSEIGWKLQIRFAIWPHKGDCLPLHNSQMSEEQSSKEVHNHFRPELLENEVNGWAGKWGVSERVHPRKHLTRVQSQGEKEARKLKWRVSERVHTRKHLTGDRSPVTREKGSKGVETAQC